MLKVTPRNDYPYTQTLPNQKREGDNQEGRLGVRSNRPAQLLQRGDRTGSLINRDARHRGIRV